MATEKQIAANRRNARKSKGPRTIEGKSRSAQNAIRHGLFADSRLLPGEDEAVVRAFREERIRELDPVGVLESDYAYLVVDELWKLRHRLPRIEAALFAGDRAQRDYRYFWDRLMQYRPSALESELQNTQGDDFGLADDPRYAEVMTKLSAAAEATRSDLALAGYAFAAAAVGGDAFGKLVRAETAALNRLRNLRAELDELQARRKGAQGGGLVEEAV